MEPDVLNQAELAEEATVNTSKRIRIASEAELIPGRVVPGGGFSVLCKEAFRRSHL